MNCPGSVRGTLNDADEVSLYAIEGNGAHDVLEVCLLQSLDPHTLVGKTVTVKEHDQDFEVDIDQEMADAIDVVVQDVQQTLTINPGQLLVEQRVVFNAWVPHGFGTLDIAILRDGISDIADFKYGKGVEVSAINNTQMKIYALGILQKYQGAYDIEGFRLKIYQPRMENYSDWYISSADLLAWADDSLIPAAKLALTHNAPLKAGEWCQKNFCKRRATCRVRAEWLLQQAIEPPDPGTDLACFEDLTEENDYAHPALRIPDELTLEQLARVGPMLDSLASWVKDVRKRIMSELGRGNEVGGMKMVEGRSNRIWNVTDELAVLQMMAAGIPEEETYTKKSLSPAQAEKKARGKTNKALLAECIEKPPGKPKLVTADDPRPPLLMDMSKVFAALEDEDDE